MTLERRQAVNTYVVIQPEELRLPEIADGEPLTVLRDGACEEVARRLELHLEHLFPPTCNLLLAYTLTASPRRLLDTPDSYAPIATKDDEPTTNGDEPCVGAVHAAELTVPRLGKRRRARLLLARARKVERVVEPIILGSGSRTGNENNSGVDSGGGENGSSGPRRPGGEGGR